MPRGFDTTANCLTIAAGISAANYDYVCRYFGHNLSKCLSTGELTALKANNVMIVTIWEDNPTADGYFSHLNGLNDGSSAYKFATDVGQTAGSAIYFAVDYDAGNAAIAGVISQYFQGVRAAFDAADPGQGAGYSIGVYGSGAVCSAIVEANLAKFAWLAGSTGWAGYDAFGGWNIKQGPSAALLGIGVDLSVATDSYGAF